MKNVDDNCQKRVNRHKCQPLVQVYLIEVVAEVQEWDGNDSVDQKAIHVPLHARVIGQMSRMISMATWLESCTHSAGADITWRLLHPT